MAGSITPEMARAELARRRAAAGAQITPEMARAELARRKAASAAAPIYEPAYDAMGASTGGVVETPTFAAPATPPPSLGTIIDSAGRMVANGMTFGLADKAAGGMDALTGQAASYDEGVTAQRAKTQGIRDAAPVAAGAAEMLGGVVSAGGLIKNGVTLAGRVGKGLIPRVGAFGAEGAAYGAATGAGNTYSDDPMDYVSNAGQGAAVGGTIGAILPVVGSAVSGLVRGAQAVAGPTIAGAGRTASALLRGAAQADEAGLRALPQIGPEAMMVDAGPSMLGLGQGAGTGTGAGRTELVNTLRARDVGTNDRLAATMNETLGPAPTPSAVRAGLGESKEAIGKQYGPAFDEASPVDTKEVADGLEAASLRLRGPAQAAVKKVRGYLNAIRTPKSPKGPDGEPIEKLDTSPETLFQTRQAIDGLLAGETDPKVIRQLSFARQGVDDVLAVNVPRIKEIDGQFSEVARQDEALTRGSMIFDKGKTAIRPGELVDEIRQGALPQGEMVGPSGVSYRMRQGARAELDRLVGTNINDLNALERTLATPRDWNQQKLEAVFGKSATEQIADALVTNRRFRQSYQDIVQGSQTAQRQTAQKALDGETPIPMDTTVTGAAARGGYAVLKALMSMSRENTKDEVGKLLAQRGPEMNEIIDALLSRATAAKTGSATARAVVANPAYLGGAGQYGGRK